MAISDAMTLDEITRLFARRDKAFAGHDAAALAADYAEDCVVESPATGTLKGRASVEKVHRDWFIAFPDQTVQSHEILSMADRVVQSVTIHGTNTGGFLGQAPTGKPFRVSAVLIFTFANHQIVHERRVYDLLGVMTQLATDARSVLVEPADQYRATLERVRMEQDLKMAADIQRVLLPERQYQGPAFEVAATSVPCRAIGGDFFDYLDLPSGAFGFALGDVSGKGPPAALLAAEIQGVLAACSASANTPADMVTRINQVLVRRAVESRFATLLYGVLSPDGRLTYCNEGHNPPFLLGRHRVRRLEAGGLILGAFKGAAFQEETVQLDRGDLLVVFSDGVTEALNADGAEFGEDRLLACVRARQDVPAAGILESVLESVEKFTAGAAQSDDLTALVLRYTGG